MKRCFFFAAAVLGVGSFWWAPACAPSLNVDLSLPEGGLPDGAFNLPKGVGEPCGINEDCRPGLACTNGACAPAASSQVGTDCVISAECAPTLFCGPERKCAPAGTGKVDATCKSDGDCEKGLRCNIVDFSTKCQPEGTKDVGGACASSADCYGGLLCAENKCVPAPPGIPPLVIPKFTGVTCDAETGPVRAYFDVPRGARLPDFFRLPYPNDIRTTGATAPFKPNLDGFPTPGADVLGYDLVDRWARFIERSPTVTGFSAYGTTTFRFSGEIDFESLNGPDVTNFVDLSEGENGRRLAHNWSSTTGRSAYVCPNSLSFRPPTGGALKANHTYAVFVTTATKAKDGTLVGRSPDFEAMLSDTRPGDADLAAAWDKYKPLRDWTKKTGSTAAGSILNAAVFTVGEHDAIGKSIAARVADTAPSVVGEWVRCGAGAKSPCTDASTPERTCPATVAEGIEEWHGIIKLPLFQKGTAPYLNFKDTQDEGLFVDAAPTSTVDVCAAVTFKTDANGPLPVVVYAHGTGGSFRSHAAPNNVGKRLADQGIAVLGIDQVGHGTRRAGSTADPSLVFFNFANPAAAQGNVLQGAADQVSLVRLLDTEITVGNVKLGGAGAKIGYWGHSQGATEGAISMPYAQKVTAVVFSGEGGSLIDSLLTKTSPLNFAALGPALISEAPGNLNSQHPVLSMFQNAIDPADPLDHAANATLDPKGDAKVVPKHLFVPYGMLDTFSTPITQQTYIAAALLGIAPNAPSAGNAKELYGPPETGAISENKAFASGLKFTMATRQYKPTGTSDGHFVAFNDPDAKRDIDMFFRSVLVDNKPPTVPAPQ